MGLLLLGNSARMDSFDSLDLADREVLVGVHGGLAISS